ncbi:hypothetical protein T439DRAFT_333650 [Meredithblackwellia eburnea MCA 4105]
MHYSRAQLILASALTCLTLATVTVADSIPDYQTLIFPANGTVANLKNLCYGIDDSNYPALSGFTKNVSFFLRFPNGTSINPAGMTVDGQGTCQGEDVSGFQSDSENDGDDNGDSVSGRRKRVAEYLLSRFHRRRGVAPHRGCHFWGPTRKRLHCHPKLRGIAEFHYHHSQNGIRQHKQQWTANPSSARIDDNVKLSALDIIQQGLE